MSSVPPPGYVAYGTPQAWGHTKPIRSLGRAAVVVQSLAAVGTAAVLAMQFGVSDAAEDFVRGRSDLSDFDDDIAPYLAVSLLAAALGIAVLVLLIVWSYRIASNLQARGDNPTWKPGLTIVAWLLGGCTLNILPFLMLREHWKRSDSTGDQRTNPLIVVWFVVTLAGVGGGLIAGPNGGGGFRFGDNEDLAESFADNFGLMLASSVASLAAAVILIVIVRQLTERHASFNAESAS